MKGRFITFEGIEGSGKSTSIAWTAEYLRARHVDVVQTHEPGRTRIGEELRHVLLRNRSERLMPLTELYLMFASRAQLLAEVIVPALDAGTWVLCDRFVDSSVAYQGGGRELGVERVKALIATLDDSFVEPNLTVLLDLPVSLINERLAPSVRDRFECEEQPFFERIRRTYLDEAAKEQRIKIVDATQSFEAIQNEIASLLTPMLKAWAEA